MLEHLSTDELLAQVNRLEQQLRELNQAAKELSAERKQVRAKRNEILEEIRNRRQLELEANPPTGDLRKRKPKKVANGE
jgi:uncharacterized coiled-coil DUF342 family protein